MVNKQIVIAGVVIAASGVFNAWMNKKPITPVIIGAYIIVFLLALMDMFGGDISKLASMLAMLAMTSILLMEFPWDKLFGAIGGLNK